MVFVCVVDGGGTHCGHALTISPHIQHCTGVAAALTALVVQSHPAATLCFRHKQVQSLCYLVLTHVHVDTFCLMIVILQAFIAMLFPSVQLNVWPYVQRKACQ